MSTFLQFTIFGIVLAAIYAVAASGLVVTYTTTGIFNFAHGAVGMFGAYFYWQLHEAWKLPAVLSVLLVLLVAAPAMGLVIDKVIMRGLEGVSEVTKVVVSIGLLFGLISLAPMIWPPNRSYKVDPFFGSNKIEIGDVGVTWHQITAILIAVAVALGLRTVLYGTRSGIAMRAVVDNRSLAQLNGARPSRTSAMSWALGSSLAALAGILVAERVGLEPLALTFIVVNAYAAAVVGRLTNLPMTFFGAVVLGLAQSYAQGYFTENPSWVPEGWDLASPLRIAMPVIILFITLLALPHAQLRVHGLVRSRESVLRPSIRRSLIGFAVLVGVAVVVSAFLSESDLIGWNKGLAYALIMLSLVPLTGYGGQISLAQMSFAGLGAYAMAQWGADGSPIGLVIAMVLAGAVGAIVALPALRLRGIYLALATLAFAFFMDKMIFVQTALFRGGSRPVGKLTLGPVTVGSNRASMILLAVVFGIVGFGIVLLRLGPFGRRLQAMKDSPAACATLGLNLTVTKMQVFVLSASIAGLGGALLASVQGQAQIDDYNALQSLPILLMAVAGGIAMVSGALFGGLVYASFQILTKHIPDIEVLGMPGKELVSDLLLLAPALIGVSLGRNPNGAVAEISTRARAAWVHLRLPRAERVAEPSPDSLVQTVDFELLGIDRPFSAADLAVVDRALHLDEGAEAGALRPGAAAAWDPAGNPARGRLYEEVAAGGAARG